jgi:hypothetical protein
MRRPIGLADVRLDLDDPPGTPLNTTRRIRVADEARAEDRAGGVERGRREGGAIEGFGRAAGRIGLADRQM